MENHETLMKDHAADRVAKGDIITTVTPEKKAEEERAEREDGGQAGDATATAEATPTTPLRHDTKVDRYGEHAIMVADKATCCPLTHETHGREHAALFPSVCCVTLSLQAFYIIIIFIPPFLPFPFCCLLAVTSQSPGALSSAPSL